MILDGHVYANQEWWLVTLCLEGGQLVGYLVATLGSSWGPDGVWVYEVVGMDDMAVESLLRYASRFARGGKLAVPSVSLANPVRTVLRRMGFEERESTPQIMVRILRPDRIFRKLAAGSDLLERLALTVSTPHRTLEVNNPHHPRYTVLLEAKENLVSRLFCCRLDLEAALDMEMVRWNARDPGLRDELSQVFCLTEWVQWFTDFV
jgi:hypothetical protein